MIFDSQTDAKNWIDGLSWLYPEEPFELKNFPNFYVEKKEELEDETRMSNEELQLAMDAPQGFRAHIISALRKRDVDSNSQAIFAAYKFGDIPSKQCSVLL